MKKVLIVSEQKDLAEDLKEQISFNLKDYEVFLSEDENVLFDIIVINELSERLPDFANYPVVLLSSKREDHKDYRVINKPFHLNHLFDEVQSAIQSHSNSEEGLLRFNQYELRPADKGIFNKRNKKLTKLTEKEIAIIKYLFKAQGKIVSKSDLLQDVWGYNPDITTHTIETHIYRLRQKVEKGDDKAQLISTEEGGYRLVI